VIGRVTQATLLRDLLGNVRRIERRLADGQAALTSGKRLRTASDDPTGAALAERVRGEGRDLKALGETVSFATAVLGAQDEVLAQADGILARARELAAQQASGFATTASRQAAAEEVAELERALLSLGNTTIGGRAIFGGLGSGAAPFAQLDDPGFDPLNPYSGPTDPFVVRTAEDTTLRLTTRGDQVFGASVAALDELRQTLAADASPAASLDALDQAAEGLRAERASVGGRALRAGQRGDEIRAGLTRAEVRLGAVEDADFAAVVTELTQLQAALQAALEAGRVLQTSILDHVRL
jgi:flagellar hook-associated protein 3 FlgL